MAQFKASLPVFAPIKTETDSTITYENGAFVGKMVKTEIKPNKVEGSLYADDALAEYETEFKDADITLETSTIPAEVFVSMFGETKTEGTGSTTPKPVVLTSKAGDAPVYGGYGFISVEVVDGVRKYLMYFVHKVKFSLPSETHTTKGDSITFNTSSIEGKAVADKSGAWRTKSYYDTADAAIAALKTKVGITAS